MSSLLTISNLLDKRIPCTLKKPLNFELKSSQTAVILGKNGAGKTTLLKAIGGIYHPSIGNVESVKFFYCGHQPGFKENLTVYDNLNFRCQLWNLYNDRKIEEALIYFELKKFKNKLLGYLSAGQKRQIAFISALLCPYDLWIFDEPYTNLDAETILKVHLLFKKQVREGKSLLFTSHQLHNGIADFTIDLNE